ncbi:MAG: acyl-ACP--UDP-N-acetylglucosamine O-acyltransferase [Planctomycetota bacterium]|nr:acyl-ACP--UDP-N-acetylglucosamine O-acyltransferase [Planctomycetota bacterium]
MPSVDPSAKVHPTAILLGDVRIGPGVDIGPHCMLDATFFGPGTITLGAGVRLVANVQLAGTVELGENTIIYPFACVGFGGQDVKFKPGMATPGVRVGKNGILREHVTIHAATKPEAPTIVGDNVFMMASSHVGHDARVGNNVVMVNSSMMGGHSVLEDNVTLGGNVAIHQFTRVGRMAFLSGLTAVSMDVPPFCVVPERNRIVGINLVGMRRSGIPREHITRTREAFRRVFRGTLPKHEMLAMLEPLAADCPPVAEMYAFVKSSKRSICPGAARPPRLFTTFLHYQRRGVDVDLAGEED